MIQPSFAGVFLVGFVLVFHIQTSLLPRPALNSQAILSLCLSNTQGFQQVPLHQLGLLFCFSLTEKQTDNFIDCLYRFGVV